MQVISNAWITVPRKAVGEMTPSRTATRIVMPVSKNEWEKSTALLRPGVIFSEVTARSAFSSWMDLISPFHSFFF